MVDKDRLIDWSNKLGGKMNEFFDQISSETTLLFRNAQRTKIPQDVLNKINQADRLYTQLLKTRSLVYVLFKAPISIFLKILHFFALIL